MAEPTADDLAVAERVTQRLDYSGSEEASWANADLIARALATARQAEREACARAAAALPGYGESARGGG